MVRQALEELKVADFSWMLTGPLIVRYLADHGATVIHVESKTYPDAMRTTPPFKNKMPGLNRSGFFANYNSNKYGITLNLNHPQGPEVAKRIIAWADVLVEGFTPGRMERWSLDYDSVRKIKSDIIMLSTSMQGQTGPYATHPGLGLQLVALSGFTHLTGWPDRIGTQPRQAYTDVIGPPFGAAALLAALDYRRRTGKGQYLDLSQYETGLHFLAPVLLDYNINQRVATRMGNRCSYAAPHGAYPCRGSDRWCAIAIFTDKEWQALCQAIGNPNWCGEPRFATLLARKENEDELDRLMAERTSHFTAEQLMMTLQSVGVAAGVVQTNEDIDTDPQLRYRGHLTMLDHTEIGRHSYDNLPFRLSKTPAAMRMAAPCLGEHNYHVCTQILGMPDDEFVTLDQQGVFE